MRCLGNGRPPLPPVRWCESMSADAFASEATYSGHWSCVSGTPTDRAYSSAASRPFRSVRGCGKKRPANYDEGFLDGAKVAVPAEAEVERGAECVGQVLGFRVGDLELDERPGLFPHPPGPQVLAGGISPRLHKPLDGTSASTNG
jgi:hypothetical protein